MKPGSVIFFEGNVGVGKTTLLEELKKILDENKYKILYEPVHDYTNLCGINLLQAVFTKDENITQFDAQFGFLTCNWLNFLKIDKNKINLIERSVLSSVSIFARNNYDNGEINKNSFDILKKIEDEFLEKLNKIDHKIIYLKLNNIPEYIERIKKRSRKEEMNIKDYSFLEDLEIKHKYFIERFQDKTDIVINYDLDKTVKTILQTLNE